MKKVCKENQRFEHEVWPVDQALTYFKDHSQKYKVELIEGFGDEEVHTSIKMPLSQVRSSLTCAVAHM